MSLRPNYVRQSNDNWSDQKYDTLKELANEGKTARAIAEQLGITRSAVIGKAHRAGIVLLHGKGSPKPKNKRRSRRNEMFIFAGLEKEKPVPPPPLITPTSTKPLVPFLELTKTCCRWPMDEWGSDGLRLFCGETALRSYPYCAWHVGMAYHISQVRR